MNINKLIKEAHENAVDKGFWECEECDGSGKYRQHNPDCNHCDEINECIGPDSLDDCAIESKCYKCNGTGKHGDIIRQLALINSELYEALDAHRNNNFSEIDMFERAMELDKNGFKSHFKELIKDGFQDELADVLIRIFDLCGYLGVKYVKGNHGFYVFDNFFELLLYINKIIINLKDCYYKPWENKSLSVVINILIHFSKANNIDIEKHISLKMAYNKTRLRKL